MKVTQFFENDRPHRVGVYQVRQRYGWTPFAYWDGLRFGFRHKDPEGAFRMRKERTGLDALVPWRGVAK